MALAAGDASMKPLNPAWDAQWMDALAAGVVVVPAMRSLAALPPPLAVVRRAATPRTFVHGD